MQLENILVHTLYKFIEQKYSNLFLGLVAKKTSLKRLEKSETRVNKYLYKKIVMNYIRKTEEELIHFFLFNVGLCIFATRMNKKL